MSFNDFPSSVIPKDYPELDDDSKTCLDDMLCDMTMDEAQCASRYLSDKVREMQDNVSANVTMDDFEKLKMNESSDSIPTMDSDKEEGETKVS